MAGRLQLIKSVLMSIASFWMSSFCLPGECLKEIDSLCCAFLWSGPTLSVKRAKVAWSTITMLKSKRGLGLRPLKEVIVAFCLKIIWRITTSRSLLARWVKSYFLKGETFWAVKSSTTLGSWMWWKLLKYRDKAKEFHRMEVRNGKTTSFWYDTWSKMDHLLDLTGVRGCVDMGISLKASVVTAVARRPWRHRSDLYNMIEDALHTQRSKMTLREDVALWKSNMEVIKLKFSTKNTWSLIRSSAPTVNWHSNIWFTHSTPKYAFMVWLAMHNKLSTGDRMLLWNVGIDVICVLCQQQLETRDHLFFGCAYSQNFWLWLVRCLLPSRFSDQWQDIIVILADNSISTLKLYLIRYNFQAALHSIWREQNNTTPWESVNSSGAADCYDR